MPSDASTPALQGTIADLEARLAALRSAPLPSDPAALVIADASGTLVLAYDERGKVRYGAFPVNGCSGIVVTTSPAVAEGFRSRFEEACRASGLGDRLEVMLASAARDRCVMALDALITSLRPALKAAPKDRVVCEVVDGVEEWACIVGGVKHGGWRSKAEAMGGMAVEQRRLAVRAGMAA